MTSTAIYTCYRQLHPPTGVDHAVFGSITGPGSRDLVVAKASILELYRVQHDVDKSQELKPSTSEKDISGNEDKEASFFLELVGTFPLAGNASALSVIPVNSRGFASSSSRTQRKQDTDPPTASQANEGLAPQDMLVVCFGTAQVALVAYDAGLGRLTTLSIHNFDANAIGPGSGGVEASYGLSSGLKDRPPTISAFDPRGRCIAAVVEGHHLVVLPTLQYIPRSVFLSEESRDRAVQTHRSWQRRHSRHNLSRHQPSSHSTRGTVNGQKPVGKDSGSRDDELTKRSPAAMSSKLPGTEASPGDKNSSNGVNGIGHGGSMDGDGAGGEAYGYGIREADLGKGEKDPAGDMATGGSRVAGAHWAVSKPFTVDLEMAGVTGFIKAIAFLDGVYEPAVAILFEPVQTWAGRLAKLRNTCRLVVMSLNLNQERSPVIWRIDHLPHDSWELLTVPSPIGGLQVVSVNAMLYVNQSEVKSILAVNGYARATVDEKLLRCPLKGNEHDWAWTSFRQLHSATEVVDLSSFELCIELDSACFAFLSPTSVLVTLRSGEVYALRLHLEDHGRAVAEHSPRVAGQSMRPVGRSSPCSVVVASPSPDVGVPPQEGTTGRGNGLRTAASNGLVFMGSRVGDSLLVGYAVTVSEMEPGARACLRLKSEPKREQEQEREQKREHEVEPEAEGGEGDCDHATRPRAEVGVEKASMGDIAESVALAREGGGAGSNHRPETRDSRNVAMRTGEDSQASTYVPEDVDSKQAEKTSGREEHRGGDQDEHVQGPSKREKEVGGNKAADAPGDVANQPEGGNEESGMLESAREPGGAGQKPDANERIIEAKEVPTREGSGKVALECGADKDVAGTAGRDHKPAEGKQGEKEELAAEISPSGSKQCHQAQGKPDNKGKRSRTANTSSCDDDELENSSVSSQGHADAMADASGSAGRLSRLSEDGGGSDDGGGDDNVSDVSDARRLVRGDGKSSSVSTFTAASVPRDATGAEQGHEPGDIPVDDSGMAGGSIKMMTSEALKEGADLVAEDLLATAASTSNFDKGSLEPAAGDSLLGIAHEVASSTQAADAEYVPIGTDGESAKGQTSPDVSGVVPAAGMSMNEDSTLELVSSPPSASPDEPRVTPSCGAAGAASDEIDHLDAMRVDEAAFTGTLDSSSAISGSKRTRDVRGAPNSEGDTLGMAGDVAGSTGEGLSGTSSDGVKDDHISLRKRARVAETTAITAATSLASVDSAAVVLTGSSVSDHDVEVASREDTASIPAASETSPSLSGVQRSDWDASEVVMTASERASDRTGEVTSSPTKSAEDRIVAQSLASPPSAGPANLSLSESAIDRILRQPHRVPTFQELEDEEEELFLYGRRLSPSPVHDLGNSSTGAAPAKETREAHLESQSKKRSVEVVGFRLKVQGAS